MADMEPVIQTAPQTAGAPQSAEPVRALNQPPTPVETNQEDYQSGNQEQGIKPSRWGSFTNSLQQAFEGSPTQEVFHYANEKVQDSLDKSLGVTQISPEEANKRFPGMPEAFSTPVDPYVAKMQYDNFQHKQHLQEWAIRGGSDPSKDFWGPVPTSMHGAQDFAAGLAVSFVDPINMALNIATSGAASSIGMSNSLRNVFLQNMVINTGLSGMDYAIQKQDHLNPTLADASRSALFGAIGGTAFHFAWGKLFPKDLQESALKTAVMQHESGASTDVTPQATEARARADGEINGQVSPYKFTPVNHPSDRAYYMAQRDGQVVATHNFGTGAYASDNPAVANSHAAANDGQGVIGEYTPKEGSKFLDLNESLPREMVDQAKAELEKAGIGDELLSKKQLEQMPAGDVLKLMQEIPSQENYPGAAEVFRARAEGEGYDGYRFTQHSEGGDPLHNGIMMFNQESAKPKSVMMSDSSHVPTVSDEAKQSFADSSTSQEVSKVADTDLDKELHTLKNEKSFNSSPEYMDDIVPEQYQQHKAALQKLAETSPSAKEALEQLRRYEASGKQELEMMKQIANCAAEGIA